MGDSFSLDAMNLKCVAREVKGNRVHPRHKKCQILGYFMVIKTPNRLFAYTYLKMHTPPNLLSNKQDLIILIVLKQKCFFICQSDYHSDEEKRVFLSI